LCVFSCTESEEERAAMLKALQQSENIFSRYYLNEDFNDIQFDFELRDDIVIGSPFRYVKQIVKHCTIKFWKTAYVHSLK
jgi:transglutaminase 1